MRRDRKIERIKQLPCFSACSAQEIAQIGRLGEELNAPIGERLFDSAGRVRQFLVIMDGIATVHRPSVVATTIGAGDHIGDVELVDPEGEELVVVAATPVRALAFGPREFAGLLDEAPGFRALVIRQLARRVREAQAPARRIAAATVLV